MALLMHSRIEVLGNTSICCATLPTFEQKRRHTESISLTQAKQPTQHARLYTGWPTSSLSADILPSCPSKTIRVCVMLHDKTPQLAKELRYQGILQSTWMNSF